MSVRLDKISNLVKEEISLIFLYKLQDPEFGLLTITNVKVSPDLKQAKIYISFFDKEKRDVTLNKINDIKGFIRAELARRINLRITPELSFFIDDTLDYVEKMDNIFKKLHNDKEESK